MGYRLDIHKVINTEKTENIYYGTKLYGYEDESNFLSYIYLVSIGKMDYDEFFDYGSNQFICLNKKEFTIFCNLYSKDLAYSDFNTEEKQIDPDWFTNQIEIKKELMQDISEYDNEVYILSWC